MKNVLPMVGKTLLYTTPAILLSFIVYVTDGISGSDYKPSKKQNSTYVEPQVTPAFENPSDVKDITDMFEDRVVESAQPELEIEVEKTQDIPKKEETQYQKDTQLYLVESKKEDKKEPSQGMKKFMRGFGRPLDP